MIDKTTGDLEIILVTVSKFVLKPPKIAYEISIGQGLMKVLFDIGLSTCVLFGWGLERYLSRDCSSKSQK